MHKYSNCDIVSLLSEIRARTGLFIYKPSIYLLKALIDGWMLNFDCEDPNKQLMNSFDTWIRDRYEVRSSQGWDNIIEFYTGNEQLALDEFFKLFDEFLEKSK